MKLTRNAISCCAVVSPALGGGGGIPYEGRAEVAGGLG